MIVVLASKNKDKLKEMRSLLSASGIVCKSLNDFKGVKDVRETGRTFEANARLKARIYSKKTNTLCVADDSGMMVRALNGKPGVYSARFAGPACTYEDNCQKVLDLLAKRKKPSRSAVFVSVAAIYYRGRCVGIARGECRGRISTTMRGKHGFGYDPIFIPKGYTKTFAQMSSAQKNLISHRRRAFKGAADIIKKFIVK